MKKQAVRYTRHPKEDLHNLERQFNVTQQWLESADVVLVQTFTDCGCSGSTFDRPGIKDLLQFLELNHNTIDYVVVSEFGKFSRNVSEAIEMIKKLQLNYNIKIVDAHKNCILDLLENRRHLLLQQPFANENYGSHLN